MVTRCVENVFVCSLQIYSEMTELTPGHNHKKENTHFTFNYLNLQALEDLSIESFSVRSGHIWTSGLRLVLCIIQSHIAILHSTQVLLMR